MARMADLRGKLKSALILPIITLVAMAGAFTYWIVGVLPALISMFDSFDLKLPALTLFLLDLSNFLKTYGLQTIGGIIVGIIVFFVARNKSETFRLASDRVILKLPILGKTLTFYYYAFISEYTRLMIAAGLPLYQALEILHQSTTNRVYKIGVANARESISIGKSFSEALAEEKMFSSLIIRMINVGEQTGRLEGQLTYISKYYFDKVDYISENIAKIIQPFFTVILGGFMIVLMLGFLMPIWDLVSGLSNYN
jgi:type II secretory pathway component PulF